MTGDYRVTATWVATRGDADPTWLLHIELMDERPGFRGVCWLYRPGLGGLEEEVRQAVDQAARPLPPVKSLSYKVVVPADVHALVDRALLLESGGAAGPDQLDGASQLRVEARRKLVGHGLAADDVEWAMKVLVDSATPEPRPTTRAIGGIVGSGWSRR